MTDTDTIKRLTDQLGDCLEEKDLIGAQKSDVKLQALLVHDGKVVFVPGVEPLYIFFYLFNRTSLLLNIEDLKGALACVDNYVGLADCLQKEGRENVIMFFLDHFAEHRGRQDAFEGQRISFIDYLMLSRACQTLYPAMSLSFLWKAESICVEAGNEGIEDAIVVKKLRKEQYKKVYDRYSEWDKLGVSLFMQSSQNLDDELKRASEKDIPEEKVSIFQETEHKASPEELKEIYKQDDTHIGLMLQKDFRKAGKLAPFFEETDSLLLKIFGDSQGKSKDHLPNLMEVLELQCYDEEKYAIMYDNSPERYVFGPIHWQEEKFFQIKGYGNDLLYYPIGIIRNRYYRGQTEYNHSCRPSLYRIEGKSKVFLERLKYCEFALLLRTYPIYHQFKLGLFNKLLNGEDEHSSISVDEFALAQHYGIATEFLDLTADKWTAAFFASSDFLKGKGVEKDTYAPHVKDGIGAFYIFKNKVPYVRFSKLHPVGLQPHSRPTVQAGYVYEMGKCQNFNNVCKCCIKFRHNSKVANIIYKYFNRSFNILPPEVIESKAKLIINSDTFSENAIEMCRKIFYPKLDDDNIMDLLKALEIKKQPSSIVSFTQEEIYESQNEFAIIDKYIQSKTIIPETIVIDLN